VILLIFSNLSYARQYSYKQNKYISDTEYAYEQSRIRADKEENKYKPSDEYDDYINEVTKDAVIVKEKQIIENENDESSGTTYGSGFYEQKEPTNTYRYIKTIYVDEDGNQFDSMQEYMNNKKKKVQIKNYTPKYDGDEYQKNTYLKKEVSFFDKISNFFN